MLRACYRHAANALTVHPRVQMLILTSALLQTGTTCEKISGTNPEMEQQMDKAVAELKTMKERADKVNKQALELQKLVEGAEKEVILLQAQLHPKRTRIVEDKTAYVAHSFSALFL